MEGASDDDTTRGPTHFSPRPPSPPPSITDVLPPSLPRLPFSDLPTNTTTTSEPERTPSLVGHAIKGMREAFTSGLAAANHVVETGVAHSSGPVNEARTVAYETYREYKEI